MNAQPGSPQSLPQVTWTVDEAEGLSLTIDGASLAPLLEYPADLLTVDVLSENGTAVVKLRGEIDASSVDIFDEALHAAAADGSTTVVVDMADLSFIDSTGLNCLVRHRRDRIPEIVLRSPSSHIRHVLEITGLHKVFFVI